MNAFLRITNNLKEKYFGFWDFWPWKISTLCSCWYLSFLCKHRNMRVMIMTTSAGYEDLLIPLYLSENLKSKMKSFKSEILAGMDWYKIQVHQAQERLGSHPHGEWPVHHELQICAVSKWVRGQKVNYYTCGCSPSASSPMIWSSSPWSRRRSFPGQWRWRRTDGKRLNFPDRMKKRVLGTVRPTGLSQSGRTRLLLKELRNWKTGKQADCQLQ